MNIWIVNHFALPPELETRVRNNIMAKYLQLKGHNVKIISASSVHNSTINLMEGSKEKIIEKNYGDLEFVHIKTMDYSNNGIKRILNHLQFPIRLFINYKKISTKPDIIISDLGVMFSIVPYYISKRLKAKFIQEVRDLWPESIVEFMGWSRKNIFVKFLYLIEKWIYVKSDHLIFSMPGGVDYIREKGWDDKIALSKIEHITNGADLDDFNRNKVLFQVDDPDLEDEELFKVIYTGSIRLANNISTLVETGKILQEEGYTNIKLLIYGEGPDKDVLKRKCEEEGIRNIAFKGSVQKDYIPYILSKSDLNVLHYKQSNTWKYGGSQNKLAEYIASGKPILSTVNMNYSLITQYNCGISSINSSPEQIAKDIIYFYHLEDEEYDAYCKNTKKAANSIDYKMLIEKFNNILENKSSNTEEVKEYVSSNI